MNNEIYTELNTARSGTTKMQFVDYMLKHPQERFWQSLLNFSGLPFIVATDGLPEFSKGEHDTYHWEGRNG